LLKLDFLNQYYIDISTDLQIFLFYCLFSVDIYNFSYPFGFKPILVWVQPATKATRGRPSPRRGAEENGKKQAENWWVGIRAV